ncbi:glycosyltransferase family 4 protein [uncultured Thiodictyon sp.]|jgi:glycosyltransferase involved in cell wall biosynthesis|uniref:glycosyltransferase family 4 protein n=1 Tax=uncultured Thiodictyon sp. TaxID=1846217 RepID=UPI0025E870AF|nr:glycosyltransferase family 4 protein [uncultured Thiodictyon sp.]
MRVAFVCFFAAAPPSGGAGSVTCALAEALADDRLLVQPGPAERRFLTPGGLPVWQLRLVGDRGWRKLLGIPGYVRRVVRLVQRGRVEVVVLEGASWVFYHWWLLQRLRRSGARLTVLYHAHNVEYELRQQRHGSLVRWLTRWAEGRVLRGVTQSFAVSEPDRDAFQRLYGVAPLLLPNGVDSRRFAGVTAAASAVCRRMHQLGEDVILFMGSYTYPPNREAIDFLVTGVLPLVLAHCPRVELAIIGGPVPYRRPWLRAAGLLPDEQVPPFIRCCTVSVAPIFSGSGTRLKILESLAAGVPVVATRKGAEGLTLAPGVEILLAEGAADFAAALVALLRDPDRRRQLGACGQRQVASRYDWTVLVPTLSRVIAADVGQRART